MRRAPAALPAVVLAAMLAVAPAASALPPAPPDADAARAHLAELTVGPEGSMDGYSRTMFPHWITQSGQCNTRETALRRDGENVETDAKCAAVSGTWRSPYDGATWTQASDLDIDHMVPLAQAWRSGAAAWTTERRKEFANDLTSSQLWTVTDNVNQAKGDKDPAQWLPPLASFRCMYARSWIDVKYRYGLTIDAAEKTALDGLLGSC
ncbi:HNH endonuclease [Actinomadura graeca]|uniref:HNH endonuclease n=2 Tax=Actinomadura graeca TaxID=2750812 RepID=A0ABX8R4C0_9ACTN|nr:HNH endonuclease [Actinomadura graeca]